MNHPIDLLVDLVDGSISPGDRTVVDAHLASCATCRRDLDLAVAGRDALRNLPSVTAPAGLGDAAIAEAERRAREVAPEVTPLRARGGRAEAPAWYRWAGAAAAAAAILLVVVVALPNVGGDDQSVRYEASTDAEGGSPPTLARGLEIHELDYDTALVQTLALGYRAASVGASASSPAEGEVAPAADLAAPDEALACLRRAVPELRDQQPARLIEARFEGTPAYLGVFLSGPGAGQPPDTSTVWVVSREGCDIVSTTSATL